MKRCPYCGADNRDDATQCYFCERDMQNWPYPPPPQSGSTQPFRVQASSTQPFSPYPTPPVEPEPVYEPYYPPAPPRREEARPERLWMALAITLGVLFVCVGGLILLTFSTVMANGTKRISTVLPTQVAESVQPTEIPNPVFDPPTPWPTFTPQPNQVEPAPVPTAGPTQEAALKKLLSPECAGALDQLGQSSNQFSSQPTIVFDSTWRSDFSQAITDMKSYCGSLDTASPVPGLVSQAQKDLSQASKEFDTANQLFNEGVKSWQPGKILQAGQHFSRATTYLNQAIAALNKIGK